MGRGWTRKRVFEPFYTTKAVGMGTGLGLSVSYFIIVTHHHGNIFVDSTPSKGTTFTLLLPLSKKHLEALEKNR
jgi:signal transduction histidine kinase